MNEYDTLIEKHFQKKPGEQIQALYDRYEQISRYHKDPLTAALLASSYYGMEELEMRLPRLDAVLRNPFETEHLRHALTGLIMVADGGPAEGAKAIQIYLAFQRQGLELADSRSYHMLALLAISCGRAGRLAEELQADMTAMSQKEFCRAGSRWIRKEQDRQELLRDETSRAYALLLGMREEVDTILEELED